MNRPRLVVTVLPQGPRDPVTTTPARRRGSVRRTTSIDQIRRGPGDAMDVVAKGRDLLTRADGATVVLDEVTVLATVDQAGVLRSISTDPHTPGLQELVGGSVSRGFRGRLDAAICDHAEAASVLHQLLDDLPMAALISGYGAAREQPDFQLPPAARERLTDLCAGWAAGATMLGALESTGVFPVPVGPPAPELDDGGDALAWHDLPAMAPRSVRRRRRLDVVFGDPVEVEAHFRDSHLGAGAPEDVLHEYVVAVTVDPRSQVVLASRATARVLPWPECPSAVASAAGVVGERLGDIRSLVASRPTGPSTCTHLDDVLRSLTGAAALARA